MVATQAQVEQTACPHHGMLNGPRIATPGGDRALTSHLKHAPAAAGAGASAGGCPSAAAAAHDAAECGLLQGGGGVRARRGAAHKPHGARLPSGSSPAARALLTSACFLIAWSSLASSMGSLGGASQVAEG